MKNKFIYTIILFLNSLVSQDLIAPNLHSGSLIDYLNNNYKTNSVLSYSAARDTLYSIIDNNNGQVFGIYTNYSTTLNNAIDPSTDLYNNGMNCEHVWPQSLGASNSPMKSDMHHLRPCKENVNSSRANKPYGEIPDNQTNTWFWLNYQYNNIPQNNIDEFSESGSSNFEPREDVKGDISRSIFYFYTMYTNVADDNFFNEQKETLLQWHYQDLPNMNEIERTWGIANYQDGYPNPFVVDTTLVRRCYFYIEAGLQGDINNDNNVNIIDVVILVDFILGYQSLNDNQIEQANMNNDGTVNIIDVVMLVESILY